MARNFKKIWPSGGSNPPSSGAEIAQNFNENCDAIKAEFDLKDMQIMNLSIINNKYDYSAGTARAAVPVSLRKPGSIISYTTIAGVITEQYIGSDNSNWTTDINWRPFADGRQLVQLEQEVNIDKYSSPLLVTEGKNLFDKDSKLNIYGKYLSPTGKLMDNESYIVTHYIKVHDLSKLHIRYGASSAATNVFYDEYFNVINTSPSNVLTLTVPTNAKYLRCSFTSPTDEQVEIGESFTYYESYKPVTKVDGLILNDDSVSSNNIKDRAVNIDKLSSTFSKSLQLVSKEDLVFLERKIEDYSYLDEKYYGWGTVFNVNSSIELSGLQIVPTSINAELVVIIVKEILANIPTDEYAKIPFGDTKEIYRCNVTDQWNANYKTITNVIFENNIHLESGKNYAIYFNSTINNIGFASYSGKVDIMRVRDFYVNNPPTIDSGLSLSGNTARKIFINLITGCINRLYKPVYEKPFELPVIKESDCSFFTSYNLCKVEENEEGKYLGAGGGLSINETYFTTGFIEIVGGKSYNATYLSDGGGSVNCLYDENKTFIGDLWGTTARTITIPTEVNGKSPKFIRCSVAIISAINKYVFTEFVDEGYKPYSKTKLIQEALPSEINNDFILWLPTEICIAEDRTIELYNSQVSWCGNINNYHFNWTGVGKNMKRKWSCKGLASLVGQIKTLTCTVYDNNMKMVDQKSTTVKFVKKTIAMETKIVPLGDSLTNSKPWLSEVVSLSNNKIKFTGTRNPTGETAGLAHEGRSGGVARFFLAENEYTYENNGKNGLDGRDKKWNPMWNPNTASFDLNYYKTNYEITFNAVQIFFGTNGINIDPTAAVTEMVTLIAKIREFEPTMKIFVVNTLFRGDQNGIGNGGATDGYVNNPAWKLQEDRKVFNLQVALTDACKALANVHMIPISVTHDSEFNFGSVPTPVNPRALNTELLPTEATHPQLQGYQQFADIIYSTYCAYIQ